MWLLQTPKQILLVAALGNLEGRMVAGLTHMAESLAPSGHMGLSRPSGSLPAPACWQCVAERVGKLFGLLEFGRLVKHQKC